MTNENFCLHRRGHEVRLVENTNFGALAPTCENYVPLALIVNVNLQKPKGLFVAVGYKPGGGLNENTPGACMKYRRWGGGVKSGVAG